MGLAADFKKSLTSELPDCILEHADPAAVVIDVMVLLHLHAVKDPNPDDPDPCPPAKILANKLWWEICKFKCAALCFDVAETTPTAKQIEWQQRPHAAHSVSIEDIHHMLLYEQLYNYKDIIATRSSRIVLCKWLIKEMFHRIGTSKLEKLYVFGDKQPVLMQHGSIVERPDLHRNLHGEADASGILAAHVMHEEQNCKTIQCRTSDTDWVLLGMLNSFQGLQIRLTHFAKGSAVHQIVDAHILSTLVVETYGINKHEWAALAISRGTDFVEKMLNFIPGWPEYMEAMSFALRAVKRTRGDLASDRHVDIEGLDKVLVSASATFGRAQKMYKKNDGALMRLAWHVMYAARVPLRGGDGLECLEFGGWKKTGEKISRAADITQWVGISERSDGSIEIQRR